jgi:hypothetical protein
VMNERIDDMVGGRAPASRTAIECRAALDV